MQIILQFVDIPAALCPRPIVSCCDGTCMADSRLH